MKNVLVTSGNIGSAVATALAQQGHQVSLMVRKAEEGESLKVLGLSLVVADASRPETLAAAFAGIDTFFFVSPLVENMVELATNIITEAKKAGIKHIVRSSANGADPNAPIAMGKLHGQVETLLKSSGIAYSIVQPSTFFQNILAAWHLSRHKKHFMASQGRVKMVL